jgi:hypothetical protein
MATKPTEIPTWATGGGAPIVEPPLLKRANGWATGERPPAQFFNWLQNRAGQWFEYLDDLTNQALSWTVNQTFQRAIDLGSALLGTEANAITPRITASRAGSGVSAYTALARFGDVMLWASADGFSKVVTVNATRAAGNTNWTKLTNSQPATALYLSRDRVRYGSMPALQNTAWPDTFIEGEGTASGWGSSANLPADSKSDSTTTADLARLTHQTSSTVGVERQLLAAFPHASLPTLRVYVATTGADAGDGMSFELTLNAKWSNAANTWARDIVAASTKLVFNNLRFKLFWNTGAASWADSAWDKKPLEATFPTATSGLGDETKIQLANGRIQVVGSQSTNSDDANPPANIAPPANSISPKSVAKSWGKLTNNGLGGVTLSEGLNASVTRDTATDEIIIGFGTAMQSADYVVTFGAHQSAGGGFFYPSVSSQSTGNFRFKVLRLPVGGASSLADLDVDVFTLGFAVHARQDS